MYQIVSLVRDFCGWLGRKAARMDVMDLVAGVASPAVVIAGLPWVLSYLFAAHSLELPPTQALIRPSPGCTGPTDPIEQVQIRRPALRYHGGKFRLAPKITAEFPPPGSYTCFEESFAGGLGVLLRLDPPAEMEYANDLDGEVVNFWTVLRERRQEFLRAIRATPYSREVYLQAHEPADDPLERARRLYIRSWQGRGGCRATRRTGWRTQKRNRNKTIWSDWTDLRHLVAISQRLRRVGLEQRCALEMLQAYDTPATLHYVDPPYLGETRSDRWAGKAYTYDFSTPEQHAELAEVLNGLGGMVALSGRPTRLYQELYDDRWRRIDFTVMQEAGGHAVESLWLSPRLLEVRSQASRQRMIPGTEVYA